MLCGERDGELCGVDRGTVCCVVWTEGRCVLLCGQRDGELCGVDIGTMCCVVWTEGR